MMEATSVFAQLNRFPQSSVHPTSICTAPSFTIKHSKPILLVTRRNNGSSFPNSKKSKSRFPAVATEVSAFTSDANQAAITWQIVVGALAGVAPFVVAGIEFGKRIVKQRQCEVCKGSGLVLRDDQQSIRCPGCGGWLPWQSWKRFFTG